MGYKHGEINAGRIRASNNRIESGNQDIGNCQRGASQWKTPVRVLQNNESDQRSCFTGSEKSEIGARTKTKRRGNCLGSITGTSGLHSETVGKESRRERQEKMKTLVTANQKGGVGKTSTLVHLAFDFYERGLKVAVIDLDTQANASFTLKLYRSGLNASELLAGNMTLDYEQAFSESNGMSLIESDAALANMEKMDLKSAGNNFRSAIKSLEAAGYDVCLIDTAPSLGVTMVAALLAADYVLSPIELEAYSIQGIKKMLTTIANIRKVNANLVFLGMVPSKVDARNPRHGRHLDELNQAYSSFMLPTSIGLRGSIADALASGQPVWKIKKTAARKAAQEVRALAAHIYQAMEIKDSE